MNGEGFARPDEQTDALHRVQALAERMLALGSVLLQAARVPAFETGHLVHASPTSQGPQRFDTSLALPCANKLLQPATTIVHQWTAFPLLDWCAGENWSQAPDGVCMRIVVVLIKALVPIVSLGKTTIDFLRAAHELHRPLSNLGAGHYQAGWGKTNPRIDLAT